MTHTAWFDEIRKDDIALAGGKGANLGELSSAGLPVPPGFIVTTTAYDAFVASNAIGSAIVRRASVARATDPAAFEEVAEGISALFSGGKVSEEMADEIRAVYVELGKDGETAVAVRSSATAEDLPVASFAGQQDTYLNVRGKPQLLESVRSCWISLFTDRAILYRAQNGFSHREVFLSVVVQKMIMPDLSGILFTSDPVS